ncbi:MAG: nitroreductase family protein [Planctomycetota bacterium]|nr:MAG: nitroreductase family protein [Planctomycetota bacterium]
MDALEAIHTRRSIRRYTSEPVSNEAIRELLRAAMMAPSARDARPWRFVVIDDRSILATIAERFPNAEMAAGAPVGILVCGDLNLEKSKGYWVVDCSAAVENLLLAAHAMGLGAVWTGVYPRTHRMEGLKELLGVPDHVQAHSLVIVGHPAETRSSDDRYEPQRVHHNRWGEAWE